MPTTPSTALVRRTRVLPQAGDVLPRTAVRLLRSDRGMTTAEYAVGTVAACGFAGVLYKLLTSDVVVTFLTEILRRAFGLLG
ncbi:MAG TPA: DUF4244 domain-containing protein [Jiangellales bacterium]|nr:DUF4244 domain-containing protein [Jiangellales bacterium]